MTSARPGRDERRQISRRGYSLFLTLVLMAATAIVAGPAAAEKERPGVKAVPPQASPGTGARSASQDPAESAKNAGIDVGSVIETVRHHVGSGPKPNSLQAEDPLYRAIFDASGFNVTLRQPGQPAAGPARPWEAGQDYAGRKKPIRPEMLPFEAAPGFGLSVSHIQMGSQAIPATPSAWKGDLNVASRSIGEGITERVTASEGRLKWDFVLDGPPRPGDLNITAGVQSGRLPTIIQEGAGKAVPGQPTPALRWPLDGDTAVRVGEMVVLDRDGKELHRALPRARNGELSLSVPAAVLTNAAYPLTIDPVVSPEYPASAVATSASAGDEDNPRVASGGTPDNPVFLVVWEDFRVDWLGDVLGARVKPDGTVLDPGGIFISAEEWGEFSPAVASDGKDFLVVWSDCRNMSGSRCFVDDDFNSDIFGATVLAGGGVGTSSIPIGTGPLIDELSPALAWKGTDYLAAWTAADCTSACIGAVVQGARITRSGSVLDSNPILISGLGGDEIGRGDLHASVAWNGKGSATQGSEALVTWDAIGTGGRDIYGTIVQGGSPVKAGGAKLVDRSGDQVKASAAWNGSKFMLVWEDRPVFPHVHVLGPGVYVADVWKVMLEGNGDLAPQSEPSNRPSNMTPVENQSDQTDPSVASNGRDFLVVWQDEHFSHSSRVRGTVIRADGTKGPDFAPERPGRDQFLPKASAVPGAAGSPGRFFVTWLDARCRAFEHDHIDLSCHDYDAVGARITLDQTPGALTFSHVVIVRAPRSQLAPAIAWDSTQWNYLVVWDDWNGEGESRIMGARVNALSRVILDGAGIPISPAVGTHSAPSVAWNGQDFLVVWTSGWDIHGASVNGHGQVSSFPAPISARPRFEGAPSVAASDGTFLVVWEEDVGGEVSLPGIRFSPAGRVISGVRVQPRAANKIVGPYLTISDTARPHYSPSVAGGKNGFLVVSQVEVTGTADLGRQFDNGAAMVAESNAAVQQVSIPSTDWNEFEPKAAWDGTSFLITWTDCREGLGWCDNPDIYGALMTPSELEIDEVFPIEASEGFQIRPLVAWNGVNFVVAWSSCLLPDCENFDIFGERVTGAGEVLGGSAGPRISIAGKEESEWLSGIVAGPAGQAAISYQRFDGGAHRAFLRVLDEVAATVSTPSSLSGPAVASFSEDVKNLSTSNFVLRRTGTTTNLSSTLQCRNASSAVVGCGSGPVRSATLTPRVPLVPGEHYSAVVNPRGAISPATNLAGAPVSPAATDSRGSTQEQQNSLAAKYGWRTSPSSSAYGSSFTTERSGGATASYAFSGTSVTWYTVKGPAQGLAEVSIDGVAKGLFNLYAPSTTYKVPMQFTGLSPGSHTIQVKVKGQKGNSAGTDTLVAIDAFQPGTAPVVATPVVSYSFSPVLVSGASGGSYAQSDLKGSSLGSFVFRGTGVDWVTVKGPKMGKADVYIDGVKKLAAVDNYSASTLYGQVRSVTGLPDGVHTLKIVALGTKQSPSGGTFVAYDGFNVK